MSNQTSNQLIPAFVIAYSDSDFTNPHELVLLDEPEDYRADYTHMGVKYTGLETCRHANTKANAAEQCLDFDYKKHNWVEIGLKKRALLTEIKISTQFFTGNQVRAISLTLEDELTGAKKEVLNRTALQPDSVHRIEIPPTIASLCHFKLYYEGGITRINFIGSIETVQLPESPNLLEKATISHVSNEHYGHPKTVVFANRGEMYMKGWESARTGFGEQVLFHLAKPAKITKIIVDTYLHRLNAPLSCHVFGINKSDSEDIEALLQQQPRWQLTFEDGTTIIPANFQKYMLEQKYLEEAVDHPERFKISLNNLAKDVWKTILPFEALKPDTYHRFADLVHQGPFTHLLYIHYPNGGIHGLKVYGEEE
jgi:allantoicase